jgi:hypothetical protein
MMGASYPTKKACREAIGKRPKFVETSLFGLEFDGDGTYTVVGPCAYTNRKWYAQVTVTNDVISKVK